MADIDKTLTRTIGRIGFLDIKMVVPLQDDREELFRDYESASGSDTNHYLSVNHFPMVIIDCVKREYKSLSRKKSIIMTNRNQHIIIKAFEQMKKIIYRDDVFYTRDGLLFTYHIETDMIVKELGAGPNNNFVLYPVVITMEGEDRQYEGVRMYLNGSDIYTDLSIDEFEATLFMLKKIDIFTYSQGLINCYLLMKDKVVKGDAPPKKKSLFKDTPPPPPQQEMVSSTIVKKDANKDFMAGL